MPKNLIMAIRLHISGQILCNIRAEKDTPSGRPGPHGARRSAPRDRSCVVRAGHIWPGLAKSNHCLTQRRRVSQNFLGRPRPHP